jgi:hypothetical protein
MRDVAATRTKARWLVWLGLLATLAGIGIFLWVFAGYFDAFGDGFREMDDPGAFERIGDAFFGQEIAGMNAIIVAVALATIGQVVLLVGVVLHIVATSRRKRVDRELTVPAPWAFPGQENWT